MKFTSLDTITRSVLQQRKLPIHYYLRYLKHASDIYRELHFGTLRVVNAKMLPIDPKTNAVPLPCDYVDYIKVGVPIGQFIKPLVYQPGINRLENFDSAGNPTSYGMPLMGDANLIPIPGVDFNNYGEFMGRQFGFNNGLLGDTFKEIRERNVIQLNQVITGITQIYLEYISDGTYRDAATMVDPLAQVTIETYMKWQESPYADNIRSPHGQKHFAALRELRARKNPLTCEDIKRSFRKGQKATIK